MLALYFFRIGLLRYTGPYTAATTHLPIRIQSTSLYRAERLNTIKEDINMNSKTEEKKLKEFKKMKRKKLAELCENLAVEYDGITRKISVMEEAQSGLIKSRNAAIDADDSKTVEICKSKMDVLEKELERLVKRQKAIAEEYELIRRAEKNNFDGKTGVWKTVGAFLIGVGTTVISGWGVVKSHQAFNDGSMVDKATKSLAERASGLMSFFSFLRKD